MTNEKVFLEIINNLRDGVYIVDVNRRITFWNDAAVAITGYSAEEMIGRTCHDNILNHIDKKGMPLCAEGCPLHASAVDGEHRENEVFLRHKEGYRVPVLVKVFPLVENGKVEGVIEIFTQNSPTVYDDDFIESLSDMALSDALTGIPNRRRLESFLNFRFDEFKNFQSKFCVLFIDIDNFRIFNNDYGHQAGDEVLRVLSTSIIATMRRNDLFGRWGGEEFVGIFSLRNATDAPQIAEKIRALVESSHIVYNDERLSVTVSCGVTTARPEDTPETILKRADELMYISKKNGKNRVTYQ